MVRSFRFILLAMLVFTACAQERSLSGGIEDRIGPSVLSMFPPNGTTNFTAQTIFIEFDEYIELNDINNQLLVSPLLEKNPDVRVRKKGITIDFAEPLKENTTYTLNFGDGVQDYTAANPAVNLKYVFSTGPELDSLVVRAKIVDAETNQPIENVRIFLYENQEDSVIYSTKPDYFGISDVSGNVLIENIKASAFKVIAIDDENRNYLYDEGEKMAFLDTSIVSASMDSTSVIQKFKLSSEKSKLIFEEFSSIDSLGGFKLKLNSKRENIEFDILETEEDRFHYFKDELDTIHFWNTNAFLTNTDFRLEVKVDSVVIDTFFLQTYALEIPRKVTLKKVGTNNFRPEDGLKLVSSYLLDSIDVSKFSLLADSVKVESQFEIYAAQQNKLILKSKLKDGINYNLFIEPNGVFSKEGFTNDTIKLNFLTHKEKYYGAVDLKISGLENMKNPVVQLLNKKGEIFFKQKLIDNKIKITRIPTGEYTLRLLEDLSNNLEWDPVNYGLKLHPEELFYFPEKLEIRSNWVLEYEWIIKTDE